MTANKILRYCLENFKDTVAVNSWGERGIFYNPGNMFKRGVYVMTIKDKDGENDRSSRLNRENVYRVNIGIRKSTYEKMFGAIPKRPSKGGTIGTEQDFSVMNTIMPHPIYAWMGWICILNPSEKNFENLKPLIAEAYEYAREKSKKRQKEVNNGKA